ncbi:GTP-binding protein [Entamoeba histolytica]|uniref:GTP-binding protein n=4 Tax=Entamoeba TaxID=5758 RepID=C4M4L8_ENTH1|nr:GTP-binding protein [Entamoeba histolytica HM-1:IMSS]XP_654099.1 GTP-binding protein [Entamoeba histolytica HM-1:IMSS]EMD43349.1 small GTPase Sar1, putative [Entamoeba histolytica KU27]BAE94746.1 Small GTPase Sar1 [Entamoeba histolytica]EAL43479.1 GTP-binding protein [Entamoeba histolytica HM-1:IMSS]EAL48713.1 GTP-binding protein [Entamoeba histolytica HM-1:IMSS]GAT96326.1 GTP-binding protein [Entamoeba histolytica]|eukprot:XP_648869.1 GTP-binding protein [Entamoeba histolytica HM-1:IMSS]
MWIWEWFWNLLADLGLAYKTGKMLFLGLDNAGKTTLLHLLKDGKVSQHIPTQQPTMEELVMGNIKFNTYDLGGHTPARKVWKTYCTEVDAVIYIVDCAAPERFGESKKELDSLLNDEMLQNTPFLILGNKIDIPGAVSEAQLREAMGLTHTTGKGNVTCEGIRPIEVFMSSIVNRQGYPEGFKWISQYMK